MDDLKNVRENNYNPGDGTDQRVQSLVFTIIIIIIIIVIIVSNVIVINFHRNGSTFDQHVLRYCHKHGRKKLQSFDVSSYRPFTVRII